MSKTEGSYNVQYLYDLQGHQVAAINPTNNQTITTEVYAGGRHWVTDNIAGNSAIFLHTDWLGTPHVWTNLNGAIEQTCSNLPFGDGLTCTGGQGNYFSDWHFTGQDHDFGSGEDHFLYRMYASTDGRWTTPDPSGLASVDPSDPQSWNRYGYVGNNPLSRVDMFGLDDIICAWDDYSCDQAGGGDGFDVSGGDYTGDDYNNYFADASDIFGPYLSTSCAYCGFFNAGYGGGFGPCYYFSIFCGGTSAVLPRLAPAGGAAANNGNPQTPQNPQKTPCAVPSGNHLSMGVSLNVATVNPFTSGGGFVVGANQQSFGATTNNYTYSGGGAGLDVGASIQSVWAWGSGSWTGPFNSISVSAGPFSGSIFWTSGKGGWVGGSFGLGVGSPGGAYEVTNYTCRSGPG